MNAGTKALRHEGTQDTPAGTARVKLRYVGPPAEGIHPIVGGVKSGEVCEVAGKDVEAVLNGGGFERVD